MSYAEHKRRPGAPAMLQHSRVAAGHTFVLAKAPASRNVEADAQQQQQQQQRTQEAAAALVRSRFMAMSLAGGDGVAIPRVHSSL
jgi:hypothetical protein